MDDLDRIMKLRDALKKCTPTTCSHWSKHDYSMLTPTTIQGYMADVVELFRPYWYLSFCWYCGGVCDVREGDGYSSVLGSTVVGRLLELGISAPVKEARRAG